jgi:hypothetical protein
MESVIIRHYILIGEEEEYYFRHCLEGVRTNFHSIQMGIWFSWSKEYGTEKGLGVKL